jgi:hypothetical protein
MPRFLSLRAACRADALPSSFPRTPWRRRPGSDPSRNKGSIYFGFCQGRDAENFGPMSRGDAPQSKRMTALGSNRSAPAVADRFWRIARLHGWPRKGSKCEPKPPFYCECGIGFTARSCLRTISLRTITSGRVAGVPAPKRRTLPVLQGHGFRAAIRARAGRLASRVEVGQAVGDAGQAVIGQKAPRRRWNVFPDAAVTPRSGRCARPTMPTL